MLAVIDLGGSNIGSVKNILQYLKVETRVITEIKRSNFQDIKKIILPGVGSFKKAMENIKKNNLQGSLNDAYNSGIPILGICLGMQLMCKYSFEGGKTEGLGWFDLNVKKFEKKKVKNIPVIGWNDVNQIKESKIFNNINNKSNVYFLHSYYVPISKKYTIGVSDVNFKYSSVISKKNLYGCQFHPEKSQNSGIQLIKNFINL